MQTSRVHLLKVIFEDSPPEKNDSKTDPKLNLFVVGGIMMVAKEAIRWRYFRARHFLFLTANHLFLTSNMDQRHNMLVNLLDLLHIS